MTNIKGENLEPFKSGITFNDHFTPTHFGVRRFMTNMKGENLEPLNIGIKFATKLFNCGIKIEKFYNQNIYIFFFIKYIEQMFVIIDITRVLVSILFMRIFYVTFKLNVKINLNSLKASYTLNENYNGCQLCLTSTPGTDDCVSISFIHNDSNLASLGHSTFL